MIKLSQGPFVLPMAMPWSFSSLCPGAHCAWRDGTVPWQQRRSPFHGLVAGVTAPLIGLNPCIRPHEWSRVVLSPCPVTAVPSRSTDALAGCFYYVQRVNQCPHQIVILKCSRLGCALRDWHAAGALQDSEKSTSRCCQHGVLRCTASGVSFSKVQVGVISFGAPCPCIVVQLLSHLAFLTHVPVSKPEAALTRPVRTRRSSKYAIHGILMKFQT